MRSSARILAVILALGAGSVLAERQGNIRNTKHNFSSAYTTNTVRATGSTTGSLNLANTQPVTVNPTEVCVYCHTPHFSVTRDSAGNSLTTSSGTFAPLWNRRVRNQTYSTYQSSTLDASSLTSASGASLGTTDYLASSSEIRGSSKLCLSCHDGTLAIGNIAVINKNVTDLMGASDIGVLIPFQGTDGANTANLGGTIPAGSFGSDTGFTRRIGTDLSNDHPISVTMNNALADADGELAKPTTDGKQTTGATLTAGQAGYTRQSFTNVLGLRAFGNGVKALLPLEPTSTAGGTQPGQIQCGTCHDPHLYETNSAAFGTGKFLRANRFQQTSAPTSTVATFDPAKDIICLACHEKNGATQDWGKSAHAVDTVASQGFRPGHAGLRDFPNGLKVWQAACLNCHDTHTTPGARRLLREGTDQPWSAMSVDAVNSVSFKKGSPAAGAALEETCFMCHRPYNHNAQALDIYSGGAFLAAAAATRQSVPDIYTDFTAAGSYHMPLRSKGFADASQTYTAVNEQCAGTEVHSIGDTLNSSTTFSGKAIALAGKDFVESQESLGLTVGAFNCATSKRHVECTDCHNPHRLVKGNHANTNGPSGVTGLNDIRGTSIGNFVSNVLKGTFGVEPTYPSGNTNFGKIPTGFTPLCGGGFGNAYCGTNQTVTKEYQICLKCHSNYAYADIDGPASNQWNYTGRPQMGGAGLTPTNLTVFLGGNGQDLFQSSGVAHRYTNQAMEFWGPTTHRGECGNPTCTGTAPEPNPADDAYTQPDHRSWHPVMTTTGRTGNERGGSTSGADVDNFRAPWLANLGNQTMYCSDCHGNAAGTGYGTTNLPAFYNGFTGFRKPMGPHGSTNPFILRGVYNRDSAFSGDDQLCLKCHTPNSGVSGFMEPGNDKGNLHAYHLGRMSNIRCVNCHIAVPHGWKHKALLADTRSVGREVGLASDQPVGFTNAVGYTRGPYYLNAMLQVINWRRSGQWNRDGDCNGGGVGTMKSTCQNQ